MNSHLVHSITDRGGVLTRGRLPIPGATPMRVLLQAERGSTLRPVSILPVYLRGHELSSLST